MKAWITKYALTSGIIVVDGEPSKKYPHLFVYGIEGSIYTQVSCGKDKEWHLTEEEALKQARELQRKKLISLAKKMKQIKELEFN